MESKIGSGKEEVIRNGKEIISIDWGTKDGDKAVMVKGEIKGSMLIIKEVKVLNEE